MFSAQWKPHRDPLSKDGQILLYLEILTHTVSFFIIFPLYFPLQRNSTHRVSLMKHLSFYGRPNFYSREYTRYKMNKTESASTAILARLLTLLHSSQTSTHNGNYLVTVMDLSLHDKLVRSRMAPISTHAL